MQQNFDLLENLVLELKRAKESERLLNAVWDELGPYVFIHKTRVPDTKRFNKLWQEVNTHFGFDDSN